MGSVATSYLTKASTRCADVRDCVCVPPLPYEVSKKSLFASLTFVFVFVYICYACVHVCVKIPR